MTPFRSPPFDATNHLTLAVKINAGKFPRIPSRYSDDLHRAIRWMLQKDISKRPSVEELERLPRMTTHMREAKLIVKEYSMSQAYVVNYAIKLHMCGQDACMPPPCDAQAVLERFSTCENTGIPEPTYRTHLLFVCCICSCSYSSKWRELARREEDLRRREAAVAERESVVAEHEAKLGIAPAHGEGHMRRKTMGTLREQPHSHHERRPSTPVAADSLAHGALCGLRFWNALFWLRYL